MYFSIAAPQVITLPDGTQLSFRVNPADTSLVELHIAGKDGTHVLTFKRNGGPNDTSFVPTARIEDQPKYKSVDDDAVRAQDPNWQRRQEVEREGLDQPLAGDTFAPSSGTQDPRYPTQTPAGLAGRGNVNTAQTFQKPPVDTKPAA